MFQPKFTISNKILNNLTKISEIKAIVERSKVLPEREVLLKKQALNKMVHASTSIEGNLLAQYQVNKVLAGEKIKAETNQILEVKNYSKALSRIWKLSAEKTFISTKEILLIHGIITQGLVEKKKCGHFRPGPVYVANVEKDKEEVIYTAPRAKQVPKLVEELLNWLKSEEANILHPVISSGLFHYQFVTIHPFTDGNGRLARLLTQLHLSQKNYDFKKILVLEDYYNNNRKAYYEALHTGENFESRKGVDLTSWLEYFTDGFLKEVVKVKNQIQTLGFAKSFKDGEQIYLDRERIKILDFVASMGKITSQDVVDILEIPKRTAQAKLKSLVENGLLDKKGQGPSTFYLMKQN